VRNAIFADTQCAATAGSLPAHTRISPDVRPRNRPARRHGV